MSVLADAKGPAPVLVYQFTERQLEELVEKIALRVAEAAKMLGISSEALRKRVQAKLVQKLPNLGPIRISRGEIDRLNGLPAQKGRGRGAA